MQFRRSGLGEIEGVVEFAISEQTGVAGDLGTKESEPEVELGPKRLSLAVTHQGTPSFRQELVKNVAERGISASFEHQ